MYFAHFAGKSDVSRAWIDKYAWIVEMKRALKIIVALLLTGVLASVLARHSAQIKTNVALRDSVAYWAAGHLLVHHQNPYDHQTVLQLDQAEGYKDQRPLVLRTPPWSLFMVAPLGLLGPLGAWIVWIGLSLACLIAGLKLCTELYGSGTPSNLFVLIGYTFAPVPACLVSGQMGLALMLGIVLFLWWEYEHPVLAGVALVVPFAKPHLLALFWVIFSLWAISQKRIKTILGFLAALAIALAFALTLDPSVFAQYREMLHTASIGNEFIPALSGVLRLLFLRRMFWVQFVPMACGLAWALWFYWSNRRQWRWRQHGPALLVVSVLTTPYEWLSDECVLLPAILQAAAFAYASRDAMRLRSKIGLVIFGLLNVLLLLILKSKVPFSTGIYFWSSLVWFSWYFVARKWHGGGHRSQSEIPSGVPAAL